MRTVVAGAALAIMLTLPSVGMAQSDSTGSSALTAELHIGTKITDRVLEGEAATFRGGLEPIYCWSKITGGTAGSTITHVWLKEGTEMARVSLNIGGSPWRTWSAKRILAGWTGKWNVQVLDGEGKLIAEAAFEVTQ